MGRETDNLGGKLDETFRKLRDKVQVLEDRFVLLSKFISKVTHVVTTTLHLLKDNQEEDLS